MRSARVDQESDGPPETAMRDGTESGRGCQGRARTASAIAIAPRFLYKTNDRDTQRAPTIELRRPAFMAVRFPALRPLMGLAVLLAALAGLGCGQKLVFPRLEFKSDESKTPSIPLTVRLDIPDAFKQTQLFYKDSCGVSQGIPLGERLTEQVKADAAGVFEKT